MLFQPRKKLSLKDYKAKREAEKARRSIEGESGSEPVSQAESTATSKEASPEPSKQDKHSNIADQVEEEDELDFLSGFDILDEVDDQEDSDTKSGYDSTESMDEELFSLLEKDISKEKVPDNTINPTEIRLKPIVVERNRDEFEVLPPGWCSISHNSGLPIYFHKETRQITLSRPYLIGNASLRWHNIPISAIPCYAYRYAKFAKMQMPS